MPLHSDATKWAHVPSWSEWWAPSINFVLSYPSISLALIGVKENTSTWPTHPFNWVCNKIISTSRRSKSNTTHMALFRAHPVSHSQLSSWFDGWVLPGACTRSSSLIHANRGFRVGILFSFFLVRLGMQYRKAWLHSCICQTRTA